MVPTQNYQKSLRREGGREGVGSGDGKGVWLHTYCSGGVVLRIVVVEIVSVKKIGSHKQEIPA